MARELYKKQKKILDGYKHIPTVKKLIKEYPKVYDELEKIYDWECLYQDVNRYLWDNFDCNFKPKTCKSFVIIKTALNTTDGILYNYNFENIPQEQNYIQIHNLFCGTDPKAINQAKRIFKDPDAKFVVKENGGA